MKHFRATHARLLTYLVTVLLLAPMALASPPQTINVRGQLLDAQGQALSGTRDYRIQFYNAATEGAAIGLPIQGQTAVSTEGLFNITVSLPAAALNAAEVWYEIAIASTATPGPLAGTDVFPNRIKVESVPFALQAAEANHVEVQAIGSGTVLESEFDFLSGLTDNIQNQVNAKADASAVYTKGEVDTSQAAQDAAITGKADASAVYTKGEVDASQSAQDAAITGKADASAVYTKSEVDASQAAQNTTIAGKANAADVYTKGQVDLSQSAQDTAISAKANSTNVYTKTQADARYALIANGVPSTAIVLSDTYPNTNLTGYTSVGSIENAIASPWRATSTSSVPTARESCSSVWTGTEMIVWGGKNGSTYYNTGGRYNPTTDSWTAMTTTDAPTGRVNHTAVWTGTEMIVWGGGTTSTLYNTGGRYNPSTNAWTAMTTTDAPEARRLFASAWCGTVLMVWGGVTTPGSPVTYTNTGKRYNPSTDTWVSYSELTPPAARGLCTGVWTGSNMIIWGGNNGSSPLNTGLYLSGTMWNGTPTTNAPEARFNHTAFWTGSEMYVWGGTNGSERLNTGGRYNFSTNTWTPIGTAGVPSARINHVAAWTGSRMVIWGGNSGSTNMNSGGVYSPITDTWTSTTLLDAPTERRSATGVWTGTELVVWGGSAGACMNTGGVLAAETSLPVYLYQKD